ncbi:hypothetical protein ACGFZP_12940 [Kitasatospora sp. NPDC048239]|uniref:hypothetical protein n=1 Tax=Kitasatospora sp. NPDC048239 TaxID=3364046 RepID=UPI0037105F93
MIPEQETYQQQLTRQRDDALARAAKAATDLRAAEDELAAWRRPGRRADRYRAAWQSARRRAAYTRRAWQSTILEARRQQARAADAETTVDILSAQYAEFVRLTRGMVDIHYQRAERAESRIDAARAECERLVASVYGQHDEDDDATRDVCGRITTILDGGQPCVCRPLDGCDCGMPINTETVRGGRRLTHTALDGATTSTAGSAGYAGLDERLPDGTCPDTCSCHRLASKVRP